MEVGKFIKALAGIIGIVVVIGSIVLGVENAGYRSGFNFTYFFICLVFGVVFCILLYGFGEIIDNLQEINYSVYAIRKEISSNSTEKLKSVGNMSNSYKTSEQIKKESIIKTSNSNWICKKCKTENDSKALYCKDCGSYK